MARLRVLKKLKERLTKQEIERRKVRMEYRTNMQREAAITRGGLNATAQAVQILARRQRLLWRCFYGGAAMIIVLCLKALGVF